MSDSGRQALVTGAAGGIGSAVRRQLESRGMRVVGVDLRAQDDILACDVTEDRQVRGAVSAAVQRGGRLDVVVNVVGISGRSLGDGPVDECTDEGWDAVLDANLRSVFLVCRAALPHLGRGSAIVNVASVLGMRGNDRFPTHAYAASKGGVVALTRAMAVTYARRGVRVNAVAPGLVATAMSERAQADPATLAVVDERQPLTGVLTADQVAAAVAFLASTSADGITGVVVPVDGGWTAS